MSSIPRRCQPGTLSHHETETSFCPRLASFAAKIKRSTFFCRSSGPGNNNAGNGSFLFYDGADVSTQRQPVATAAASATQPCCRYWLCSQTLFFVFCGLASSSILKSRRADRLERYEAVINDGAFRFVFSGGFSSRVTEGGIALHVAGILPPALCAVFRKNVFSIFKVRWRMKNGGRGGCFLRDV